MQEGNLTIRKFIPPSGQKLMTFDNLKAALLSLFSLNFLLVAKPLAMECLIEYAF